MLKILNMCFAALKESRINATSLIQIVICGHEADFG